MTEYREAKGRSLKSERSGRASDHIAIHGHEDSKPGNPAYMVGHHYDNGGIQEHEIYGHDELMDHLHEATSSIKPFEYEDEEKMANSVIDDILALMYSAPEIHQASDGSYWRTRKKAELWDAINRELAELEPVVQEMMRAEPVRKE